MRLLSSARRVLALFAGFAIAPALAAQVSPTCQFAISAYFGTQVELESAKKAHRECVRDGRGSCAIELARIDELRHMLKLARDYLDRYCAR